MAVYIGEIHTELSGAHGPAATPDAQAEGAPTYPGVREDEWRSIEAQVRRLRRRVRAEDFDD